jgi:hypothetical protein
MCLELQSQIFLLQKIPLRKMCSKKNQKSLAFNLSKATYLCSFLKDVWFKLLIMRICVQKL